MDVAHPLEVGVRPRLGDELGAALLHRLVGALTLNEWTLLAMVAFWLSFLLLSLGEWRESIRPNVRA